MRLFVLAVTAILVILSSVNALTPPSFSHLLHMLGVAPSNSPSWSRRDVAVPSKLGNVTQSQYIAAKNLVDDALLQVEEINEVRFASPSRNHYSARPGNRRGGDRKGQPAPFKMTPELKAAAALTNKIDNLNSPAPAQSVANRTFGPLEPRAAAAGTFWMQSIARKGAWPWGKNPNHKVFRNVKNYGAKGDGVTDDTDAINKAIAENSECSKGCYGSTTMGAIIYFPPGTYLIQSTIEISYGMQVVGDANDPPTLKSTKSFYGMGVLSTDKYWGDGLKGEDGRDHEYYINTANFHRQIRNFVIDTRQTTRPKAMAALHYQVAQATSLQNVKFMLSTDAATEQVAIYAENGSGGVMSDLSFIGGKTGIFGGNQQFTAQRLEFLNVRTAVEMLWDWGWVWKSIKIENSHIGFNLTNGNGDGHVGSITVVDSVFKNCDMAMLVANTNATSTGRTSLSLDNVLFDGVATWLREQSGKGSPKENKFSSNRKAVDMLTVGRTYQDAKLEEEQKIREFSSQRVKGLLGSRNPWDLPKQPYAERPKPQYEGFSVGDFVHVKDSCKGDGITDDTACFQKVLNDNMGKKIVYVDAGTYILTDTVILPKGSHIVGENWAQLAAYGPKFQNPKQPKVMLRIGEPGDVGQMELQDLVFTSKGPTPGAVFVEWNIKGYTGAPGSAGMWDCHVRVGGALGTGLTSAECPPSKSGINPNCQGGSMMMHLTKQASAYLENVWLWTADHDLDDPTSSDNMNSLIQTSVYVARGFLIESKNPTWLYGTSSEHAVFYQYQFFQASNLVAGIIQTEQPYYQPTPKPPEPFKDAVGAFNGDPTFPCTDTEPCDEGWALRVVESSDLHIIGAGLYSWFDTYTQDCVPKYSCQKVMTEFKKNYGGVRVNNLITIGATSMINADGKLIGAKDNLAVNIHPFWSNIVLYSPGGSPRTTPVASTQTDSQLQDLVDRMNARLHEDCYRFPECVDMDNPQSSSCQPGYTGVGYDRGDCGNQGRPICCKSKTRPSSCIWRGGGLDCNGQCHEGEVHLFWSRRGGLPTEGSESRCNRGEKVFCCKDDEFLNLIRDCRWTGCGETCAITETDVAFAVSLNDACGAFKHDMHYCCGHNRAPLKNCHWVGQGDCADNTCNNREVVLARDSVGDGGGCYWGRKKVLCCTPDPDLSEFYCEGSSCGRLPELCEPDEYYWDEDEDPDDDGSVWDPAPPWVPPKGYQDHDELRRRELDPGAALFNDLVERYSDLSVSEAEYGDLVPRQGTGGGKKGPKGTSGRRRYEARAALNSALSLWLYARRYLGPSRLYSGAQGRTASPYAYRQVTGTCGTTEIEQVNANPPGGQPNVNGFDVDHPIELQFLQELLRSILNGILPSRRPMLTPAIPFADIEHFWNFDSHNLASGGPRVAPGTKSDFLNINDRFYEALGSTTNRKPFRLFDKSLNGMKGRLMNINDKGKRVSPVADETMELYIEDAIELGADEEDFLNPLREVIVIWRYLHHNEVLPDIQNTRRILFNQSSQIAQQENRLRNLPSIFEEVDADYWQAAADWAADWVRNQIATIRSRYQAALATGQPVPNAQRVFNELRIIEAALHYIMTLPPY